MYCCTKTTKNRPIKLQEPRKFWKELRKWQLWNIITIRWVHLLGHVMGHNRLLSNVLEAESGKERGKGRFRLNYISQIIKDIAALNAAKRKERQMIQRN